MDLSQTGDVFKILGGIIAALNFVGIIFLFFANKMAFTKIMTNDLHHLSKDIGDIKEEQSSIMNKVIKLGEAVAYIKGQSDVIFATKKRTRRVTKRKVKDKV